MQMLRRIDNSAPRFSRIIPPLAIRERAVTARLAAGSSVPGAHDPPERREIPMRRITPLILVLLALATAAFPLAASANHGGPHGSRSTLTARAM